MTRKITIATALFAAVVLLAGCSKNNQQAFSKRKYMPWFMPSNAQQHTAGLEWQQEPEPSVMKKKVLRELMKEHTTSISILEARAMETENEWLTLSRPLQPRLPEPRAAHKSADQNAIGWEDEPRQPENRLVTEEAAAYDEEEEGIALLLLIIIAILLPPLAVLLVDGLSLSFLLSIILWLLFYIPGLIYALYVIFRD